MTALSRRLSKLEKTLPTYTEADTSNLSPMEAYLRLLNAPTPRRSTASPAKCNTPQQAYYFMHTGEFHHD